MKRFIDLGDQTGNIDYAAGEREFAFYDTVRCRFEEFSGFQRWNSVEDFKYDYTGGDLQRYLNLIPKDYFNTAFYNKKL